MLKLDTPIVRTLSGKQEHLYRVILSKGEAVKVELEQRSVDVAMSATVGDGKDFAYVDVRKSEQGIEPLYLITENGTEVRIKVTGASLRGGAGQYSIKLAARRETTEEDRQLFKGQTLGTEAIKLAAQNDLASKKQAWPLFEQSLLIWQNQKENAWRATTLLAMGRIALESNNFQEARDFFSRASTLGFNLEDAALENFARQGLCHINNALGEQVEEIKCLDKLAPFLRATDDKRGLAQLQLNKALSLRAQNQSPQALSATQEAIPLFNELKDKVSEADSYDLLGQLFLDLKDQRKAIGAFTQYLLLRRALNDQAAELVVQNRIGELQLALGENENARESFIQALKLAQALGNKPLQASLQHHLGELWAAVGDTQKALTAYREARQLATFYANQEAESRTMLGFGRCSIELNQTADVAPALARAAELTRLQGHRLNQTNVALLQSRLATMLSDASGAREAAQRAYALAKEIGHYPSEYQALMMSARAARTLGDTAGALKDSEAAYLLSESPRGRAYAAEVRNAKDRRVDYELYLDLLMQENARKLQAGYNTLAFQLSERMRANNLLDLLTAAKVDFSAWADPDLLRRERELTTALRKREADREQMLNARQPLSQIAEVGKDIERLSEQYQQAQKKLFETNPRYALLVRPKLLSLEEIQAMLDADTALIEYAIGSESSTAWVVTNTGTKSFTLAAGTAIEALAQRVVIASAAPVSSKTSDALLRELSAQIIAPVIAQIKATRLLIVPDGALHFVPFAALYEDKTRTLSTRREIAYLPSASILPFLYSEPKITRAAGRDLAIVSDPVLQPTDTRIPTAARANAKEVLPEALAQMANDAALAAFTKRALTRRTPRITWASLNKEITFKAFDFNASRNNLLDGHYGEFYAVHFDVPTIINTQRPELSGMVFSLVNADAQPIPGFLSLSDLYQLSLNAHLVTLPAARTTFGTPARSEALIGLTRGLMYAGVRNVVTPLWEVESQATAEFMNIFYENLLDGKLKPPAALRAAQAVMRKNPRWSAPHYWASFVIEGSWR